MDKFAAILFFTLLSGNVWATETPLTCFEYVGCFNGNDSAVAGPDNYPLDPEKLNTKFTLFTRNSAIGYELSYKDVSSLAVVAKQPLAVVIHGWGGWNSKLIALRSAMLKVVPQVIWIDWLKAAPVLFYFRSVINSQLVGRQLAVLLEQLRVNRGLDMESVHLIGFSLGAHVSGYAARWLQSEYNQTVGRISALDAASPSFELASGEKTDHHVSKKDAIFVDAIHTHIYQNLPRLKGSRIGSRTPFGHVDFYPNGGKSQPHCDWIFWDVTCHHYAAVEYFTYSIEYNMDCAYFAVKCSSFEEAEKGLCSNTDNMTTMGFFTRYQPERGIFYLKTAVKRPFCNIAA
ncbi:Pancreatic lipase-related protein 2 [Halotydeus destructor]|nr:Pancreatic lipase-related protein 2 [Halotydeus destructor]